MLILFEWLVAIILFFVSIAYLNGENNGYSTNINDVEFGVMYLFSATLMTIIAVIHTKLHDSHNQQYHKYDWDAYNEYSGYSNSSHKRYMPNNSTYEKAYVQATNRAYVYKTTSEVVKDIVKDYPTPSTVISTVKTFEVKKKSFLGFKTKEEIIESTIESTNQPTVTVPEVKEETTDYISEIYRTLMIAIQQYVWDDYVNIIKSHIFQIEKIDDNVNIYFTPSKAVDIEHELDRYCIITDMGKNIKSFCVKNINFLEVNEKTIKKLNQKNMIHEHAKCN